MRKEKLTLLVAGDLVPSRRVEEIAGGFAETVALLQSADLVFGDLEIPLATRGQPREKTITFRAAPEIAVDLRRVGFDVLSLANNHSFDYGYDALAETIENLAAQGIRVLGAGSDLREAEAGLSVEIHGWRVGFLAWSCLLPSGAAASDERPGLAPIHVHTSYEINPYFEMEEPGMPPRVRSRADDDDLERALGRVHDLCKAVHFLVVSIHWGYGAGDELAEYQQPLGRSFVDAGADLVLGNHVHAVHGVELYRRRLILYSPGNFIAQQPRDRMSPAALAILDEMSPDGYIALFSIEPGSRSYQTRFIPVVTNRQGLPEPARGPTFERIADQLQRLSKRFATEVRRCDGEVVIEAGWD
jgi:poly-gamma-glutamate capsule biosynthesis protein CapA/YwtB (metallophosphatase superfamily)